MAYIGGNLHSWFKKGPNDRAMKNIIRIGTVNASGVAKENTPVETGHLREEWKTGLIHKTMTAFGIAWRGDWYNDTDYAVYVDQGTGLWGPEHRKYLILPKTPGGTLHWVDRVTGDDVYAKAVLHPGSPGNHMIAISANVLEAAWSGWARPAMRNWAREVAFQNHTAVGTP